MPDLIHQELSAIERERSQLRRRINNSRKYTISYLGAGDFLIHVAGLDPQMDRVIDQFNALIKGLNNSEPQEAI